MLFTEINAAAAVVELEVNTNRTDMAIIGDS